MIHVFYVFVCIGFMLSLSEKSIDEIVDLFYPTIFNSFTAWIKEFVSFFTTIGLGSYGLYVLLFT